MASTRLRRTLFWIPVGLALLAGFGWVFRPQPVAVDIVTASRGPLQVTVSQEGTTAVRDVFVVSAPVSGLKRRIPHQVGDAVRAAETVIASIEPTDPAFLDVRAAAEGRAAVQAAEAATAFAEADVERARAELAFARNEVDRHRQLHRTGNVSQSALDEAERRFRTQTAAVQEAEAHLRMREFELEQARARLMAPSGAQVSREECDCVHVYSPVDGRILRMLQESEGVVQAGTPLVEIGDPRNLEVVVDLLSSDAVRVEPGQRVLISEWGGPSVLEGAVRRVEPYAFTKVSALGIEEQRVNVRIDITAPPDQWARLGHGYRVETDIVLWESVDVLKLPLSALFRDGERWAVFAVEDDVAHRRDVGLGRRNGLEAEILSGLEAGEAVVLHPGDRVADGVGVVSRS